MGAKLSKAEQPEKTRRALLTAARELFAERGFCQNTSRRYGETRRGD